MMGIHKCMWVFDISHSIAQQKNVLQTCSIMAISLSHCTFFILNCIYLEQW